MVDKIMNDLLPNKWFPRAISLFGMAGIGKTILAREIFEDPSTLRRFDHCIWISLGPKYQSKRILVDILVQIDSDIDKMCMKEECTLRKHLCKILSHKKCLFALDDVWNHDPFLFLDELYPDIGIEILLTTRLEDVADVAMSDKLHEIRLLNNEESWCLLREKVFAEDLCPPELEKAGKMIAEECDGLPLMIVVVASLLSKANKIPEFWDKVAKEENLIFKDAIDKILKVLLPSYEYLPQYLKLCYLYIGIFPKKYEIPASKLFMLWGFDGIIEQDLSKNLEDYAMGYLGKLVSNSVVMVGKKKFGLRIKTCSLHSVFWQLCIRIAMKNKFFYVLNRYSDSLEEDMKSQRRLCIQKSILLGIKDVQNSIASTSNARSLLCTGPPHQYPLPICFGLRLLRVLDALTIRLYKFPIEVLNLVNLRYLAFTYNGVLPPSISKLKNLECLIIRQHLRIRLYGAPSYLPVEIWDMQELKHLQVMGSSLPDPSGSASLPHLETLVDISAHSCTERILKRIPNLKKLGIQIELGPGPAEPLGWLNCLSFLQTLESLKFVIVNLGFKSVFGPPPTPLSMFASSLRKLSLSGLGYPWGYMRTIALLPNLEVLKLRSYAFQGPEWVVHEGELERLGYLLLEDIDLECWRANDTCFPLLVGLTIRHGYKLKAIPQTLACVSQVHLVDCNPDLMLAFDNANVHSSWDQVGNPRP